MENTEIYETVAKNLYNKASDLNTTSSRWSTTGLLDLRPEYAEAALKTAQELVAQKKLEIEQLELAIITFEVHKEKHTDWSDSQLKASRLNLARIAEHKASKAK